ncbi:VOC family protein [Micromonospora sp. NPDC050980]|uniref:VOC family protein n=1 Tax=Micromonospora sp. NPDC050980 TaxID=3155161 RepID=UPI0033F57DDA
MSAGVFVNLPVRDLDVAVGFFTALGFAAGPRRPGADSAQLRFDGIHLVLHLPAVFEAFAGSPVCDTGTAREVIIGLGVDRREQVDALVERAVAAGGEVLGPGRDLGHLYMRGFRDPDGHQWSFLHMEG